jgi:hypothetical protein
MGNKQTQRLLYDAECKDCNHNTNCEWVDTLQCCRKITDKLRLELRNNRKLRKIVAKISITTEYTYNNHEIIKSLTKEGTFVLQEPYKFGKPFSRAEIGGINNCGTFKTEYYGWK